MIQGQLFYNPETGKMSVRDCDAILKSDLQLGEELIVYDKKNKRWLNDFLGLSLDGEWCLPRCILKGKALNGITVRLYK